MKKAVFFIFVLLVFSACKSKPAETDNVQIPEVVFIENGDETDTQPTPTPSASPTPQPEQLLYDNGILGVKFMFLNYADWHFGTFGAGSTNSTLLSYNRIEEHHMTFSISEFSFRRSDFDNETENYYSFTNNGFAWSGEHSPYNVFTNENGITVVQYNFEIQYEFEHEKINFTHVLFIFRRDGRDYREIDGRQIIYIAELKASTEILDIYYDDAYASINSLLFLEDPSVNFRPSAQAESIGITEFNYPRIDGSTSVSVLITEIVHAMYDPVPITGNTAFWEILPYSPSRTIPAYELLINGEVDMILVPDPSAYVLNLAEESGVELEFIPIAVEALVFITSTDNPVSSITLQQLLDIYANGTMTDWAQLGGNSGQIIPLYRNWDSGSQTLMDNLVLQGRVLHPSITDIDSISEMMTMLDWVAYYDELNNFTSNSITSNSNFALGYTVYYYLQQQMQSEMYEGYWDWIKPLAIDGVLPTHETIVSGEYPLSTNYFAVIRADSPENSPERIIIDWLLSPEGQDVVEESGLGRIN